MQTDIKTGIVPPNGWTVNFHGIEFKSYGYEELQDMLIKYRSQNMLPIGDPAREIRDYICGRYPQQCGESRAATQPTYHEAPKKRLIDKIQEWCHSIYTSDRSAVTDMEAMNRASYCHTCPMQTNWEDQCPKCVQDVRRLTMILRNGKDTPYGQQCKACRVYEFDTRTAVWLKDNKKEPLAQAPARCFIGK
jgi:hypothetical protein